MFKRIAGVLVLIVAIPTVALAHGGSHKKVMGTVSKIEVSKLHVTTNDGHDSDVPFDAKTSFVKNGKKATVKDVAIGSRVVIELTSAGTAEKVTVGKTMTTAPHTH